MFTIGQLARICSVSTKTLRYYEEIGLISPSHVNPETQYRYYEKAQISLLKRIIHFKELGISLEMIKHLVQTGKWEDHITLRAVLSERADMLKREIHDQTQLLERIERALDIQKDLSHQPHYINQQISLKETVAVHVVGKRSEVRVEDLPRWTNELRSELKVKQIGPTINIFHNPEFDPHFVDVEVLFPVEENGDKIIPPSKSATLIHVGNEDIGLAYELLYTWIYEHGYTDAAPPREIHHVEPNETNTNEPVLELQVPILSQGGQ